MRYFVLLLMGLISLPALALTKINLYQAEVVIDEQHNDPEADARIRAMQEVIVRAAGSQDSLNNDVVSKALRQSAQYANQISYGQLNDQRTLRVAFSGPRIRALLTQAHLAFWPEDRANILVWLVEESDYERRIIWEHSQTDMVSQLKRQAEQRGLPLTFPVGDFEDVTSIQSSDLWGGFTESIATASQRYTSDAILVLRAQGSTLRWALYDQSAEQMLTSPKVPVSGQTSGEEAMNTFIDVLANHYAKKSAVLVGSESSQTLWAAFKPINNAQAFFTLEESVRRLSSVASLDIVSIRGDEVIFNVHLLASEADFAQEVLRLRQVTQRAAPKLIERKNVQQDKAKDGRQLEDEPSVVTPPKRTQLYFSWQD
ncbi:DUF2066 domain-containing protein [Vibrio metschnikovii]|uniref:DUF2066 domain-containing protein n=1 Tax=Vibrio metschnikovii TaxID=28172 RepID=UPI001C30D5C0|nr:DUF2066 domain-containing protein [Vibrio metschnikovii]